MKKIYDYSGFELIDTLGDHNLQISKPTDLHFLSNYATLISICHEGVLGERDNYAASLNILMENLVRNSSVLNQKIINWELPSIMLS